MESSQAYAVDNMKLVPPFPLSTIVQPFGANAVTLYSGMGLKGHPGIDFQVPWGVSIPASIDAYCYSVIKNTDPGFYQCVYTIYDDSDGNSYEVSYGHCSSICAVAGTSPHLGDILGQVGNTGSVFANGVEVTTAQKLAGSHVGAHLHFQVRLLKKVKVSDVTPQMHTINDGSGRYQSADGYCYYVPFWDNGYNGCIDPAPFFTDSALASTIKAEVEVLNKSTDPSVRKGLLALIVAQAKKLLGF